MADRSVCPTVNLQVAVGSPTSSIVAAAALVPFDVILADVGAIFDVGWHTFFAPRSGPYRFEYTVALKAAGASDVQVRAQVGNLSSVVPIPQLGLSAVIDMFEGQSFSLTASNVDGACTILGPPVAGAPYLGLLCVYSLC